MGSVKTKQIIRELDFSNLVTIEGMKYSENDKGLYIIGIDENTTTIPKGQSTTPNGLYFYNLETNKIDPLYSWPDGLGYINNYTLMYN